MTAIIPNLIDEGDVVLLYGPRDNEIERALKPHMVIVRAKSHDDEIESLTIEHRAHQHDQSGQVVHSEQPAQNEQIEEKSSGTNVPQEAGPTFLLCYAERPPARLIELASVLIDATSPGGARFERAGKRGRLVLAQGQVRALAEVAR
jgi:hypothetical protein